MSLIKAWKS